MAHRPPDAAATQGSSRMLAGSQNARALPHHTCQRLFPFLRELKVSAYPVDKIGYILFRNKLSLDEVLLKLRQALIFVVCQISHIIRLSLLVLITRLYEKPNSFNIVFKAFFLLIGLPTMLFLLSCLR